MANRIDKIDLCEGPDNDLGIKELIEYITNVLYRKEQEFEYDKLRIVWHKYPQNVGSTPPKYAADVQIENQYNTEPNALRTINYFCRNQMIQWYYDVADDLFMKKSTIELCITYLDRFMDGVPHNSVYRTNEQQFQLVCVTCLYCAIKLNENDMAKAEMISGLLFHCDWCTMCQISDTEKFVYKVLQWKLHPPTTESYIFPMVQIVFYLVGFEKLSESTVSGDDTGRLYHRVCALATLLADHYVSKPIHCNVPSSVIAYCAVVQALYITIEVKGTLKHSFMLATSLIRPRSIELHFCNFDPNMFYSIDTYLLYYLHQFSEGTTVPSTF
jgi:Cyclin, N-terminal domain